MKRHLEPEWLDALAPDDPRAVGSRRDLRRLNSWMGNAGIMARALRRAFGARPPKTMVELGAGDGDFMVRVARRLAPHWKRVNVTLLDRQDNFNGAAARLEDSAWRAHTVVADAFDWLEHPVTEPMEAIVANLFLHHFSEAQLSGLFRIVARTTRVFIAIEPRRSALSMAFVQRLRIIGCNAVTRHDAILSVRAGFSGNELSALWPGEYHWQLAERSAGLFGHLFLAQRKD